MFITASSRFDRETAEAVALLRLFGKHQPEKRARMWTMFFAVLAGIILGEIILLGGKWYLYVMLVLSVFMPFLIHQMRKTMPAVQYDKFGDLKDTETRYLFGEDRFIMTAQVEDFENQHPVEYANLTSVYETDRYLFLYHKQKVMYIADKSTVADVKLETLTGLLQDAVPKYVRCKY